MVELKLKVVDAHREDAYHGIVKIDSQMLRDIDARPGDVVEIEGNRKTVAIADRAYPTDIGEPIIRMDGIIRRNAKTNLGEIVKVKKVDKVDVAKEITLAPATEGVVVDAAENVLRSVLLNKVVTKGDIIVLGAKKKDMPLTTTNIFEDLNDVLMNLTFANLRFIVVDVKPKGVPVIIGDTTTLKLSSIPVKELEEYNVPQVTYEDIGGLKEEIQKVRELVELPLKYPEVFERLGISPPKGILLYGPPGTGKTLLAKAVANETDATFIEFKNDQIISGHPGETERRMKGLFDEATKNSPSIVFIDELDSFAFKREERGINEFLNTPVMELLKNMDGLKDRGHVIVIAATNRIDAIDPALRRPGRFDREISIGIPDMGGRYEIMKIHTRNMPLEKDVDLKEIASFTHGFVGADLESLCKEAAICVLRRLLPEIKLEEKNKDKKLPDAFLKKLIIGKKDFENALKYVVPSAMREVLVEIPNVKWQDIGGLDYIKEELKEAVEWPLKFGERFKKLGIKAPKGILLYGPPGTGKTLLAKAVANESEANFIAIKGPELLSKWVGESEAGVRKIFEKARQVAPSIVFIDEIDAMAPKRGYSFDSGVTERVVNQLLIEMDGLEELNQVTIIAATNRPDILDPALLRAGRFDKLLHIKLPDKKTRSEILKVHTKNMPLSKEINLEKINEELDGYSGADVEFLCREAGLFALRGDKDSDKISKKDFENALKKVKPSLSLEDAKKYEEYEEDKLRQSRGAAINDDKGYFG